MRVLVTFAVEAEFAPWRDIRDFRAANINTAHYSGGREVYEARIGDLTVWVFLTGIGIRFFDFESACCFWDAGVDAVISSGLAGALKDGLALGEVIVPARVGNLKDATGLSVSPELFGLAERRGAKPLATMLTADHIVATQEEKARLSQFAEAVDMESFNVVECFSHSKDSSDSDLPVVVVRAISDRSDQDLPLDFAKCLTPEGRIKVGSLFAQLIGKPARIPGLVRFGQQSRSAAKRLALFLDGFVEALTPEILNYRAAEAEAE